MDKICTSIEQSKKLLELGIDINTADMHYHMIFPDVFANKLPHFAIDAEIGKRNTSNDLPAWSLSALLELIPNFNMFKRTIECKIETTSHLVDKACKPIDAAFEMVCWLKENGKI